MTYSAENTRTPESIYGSQIGRVGQMVTIDQPLDYSALSTQQRQLLTIATAGDVVGVSYEVYQYTGDGGAEMDVDLALEDFSDGNRWQKIDIDFVTGTNRFVPQNVFVATDQTVLVQLNVDDYGLWRCGRA